MDNGRTLRLVTGRPKFIALYNVISILFEEVILLSQFWTLSIVLLLFKNNFSEIGFCLRFQLEPTHLEQGRDGDRDSLYLLGQNE
jgi:hypothetical protein